MNADALDDLEASDVLRLTVKPREVSVSIPPSGKKVLLNIAPTEAPKTVINRLVTRYFNRDPELASALVLVDTVPIYLIINGFLFFNIIPHLDDWCYVRGWEAVA